MDMKLAAYARHADRIAIRYTDGEWTYGDLADASYRTARHGCGRGDGRSRNQHAPQGARDRVPTHLRAASLAPWRETTQLLCTQLGHLGGTLAEVVLTAGGRVVPHDGFDPEAVLTAIEREQVSMLWLLPMTSAGKPDGTALRQLL